MAQVELITAARLRERLHYDQETGAFTNRAHRSSIACVGDVAGCLVNTGYRSLCVDYRHYSAHRLAWLYMTGEWPKNQIDHINGDRADNRWCNLREADSSKNQANSSRRPGNTSGFKGVSWDSQRRKWRAGIKVLGRSINLGCFDSRAKAYAAFSIVARKHYGEYARLYDWETMIEPGPQSLGNDWLGI